MKLEDDYIENRISKQVIGILLKLHKELGPGLYESVYQQVLEYELKKDGLRFNSQAPINFKYDGVQLDLGFKPDLIVENLVIVELKSVEQLLPVHYKQLQTYLKLSDLRLGLLVNFNVVLLKDGIKRIVNGLEPEFRT
jgi:GxxExxY protein